MSQKETHDFMNVSSFSQLPFIRPTPAKDKPPASSSSSSSAAAAIRLFGIDVPHDTAAVTAASADTGRKFECHYCGRSFPTSQALGGHQNAHKRERQHAKRAQLQSTMAASAAHRSYPIDGLLNYHHLTSRFSFASGAFHSQQPSGRASAPIHGSPLPALWRGPVQGGMRPVIPFFRDEESSSSTISSISPQSRFVCTEVIDGGKEKVSLDLHL